MMSVMMDWEETSVSRGGDSGSSLNSHSETEDDGISFTATNHITTLNLKLNNNNLLNTKSIQSLFNLKESPSLLHDGVNGLNLNPSPPLLGQDLSISNKSETNNTKRASPSNSSSSIIISNISASSGSSNSGGRKNKPIPPPLDLSIGASSLNTSSQSSSSSSTGSATFQYPGNIYSPAYLVGSPKFNQAEKSLPLRKRWHSWSPKPMNPEDQLIPLYTENGSSFSGGSNNSTNNSSNSSGGGGETDLNTPKVLTMDSSIHFEPPSSHNNRVLPPSSASSQQMNSSSHNNNSSSFTNSRSHHIGVPPPLSAGLQTPTPFYTPNETSPRFMNSPVFSYSTPDTTLYQGPFSPSRTTSLYPPGSPFLSSSLNTPNFILPTSSSTTLTSVGASSSGSTNSSSSSTNSNNTLGSSPVYTGTTMISPASSQASSSNSYEEVGSGIESAKLHQIYQLRPSWNMFLGGTKVRFMYDNGHTSGWYPVDLLAKAGDLSMVDIKGEYAPNGLTVKQTIVTSSSRERVQITFYPTNNDQFHQPNIEADCEPGHPFFVIKKGWCAVKPDEFSKVYGYNSHLIINSHPLQTLDICVNTFFPPHQQHQQIQIQQQQQQQQGLFIMSSSSSSNNTCSQNSLRSNSSQSIGPNMSMHSRPSFSYMLSQNHHGMEDIKPSFGEIKPSFIGDVKGAYNEDMKLFPIPISVLPTSSVHSLGPSISEMNGQMESNGHGGGTKKLVLGPVPKKSKVKKSKETNNNFHPLNSHGEPKGRRPMNAFLVYAKEKRPLLIQRFPGKDNRSISTLLGDSWKKLGQDEKNYYIRTAKESADEQKKLHPDCWKRKRSQPNNAVV